MEYNKSAKIIDDFLSVVFSDFCCITEQCIIKLEENDVNKPILEYINNKMAKHGKAKVGSWIEPNNTNIEKISEIIYKFNDIGMFEIKKGYIYLFNLNKHLEWNVVQTINAFDVLKVFSKFKDDQDILNSKYWEFVCGLLQLLFGGITISPSDFINSILLSKTSKRIPIEPSTTPITDTGEDQVKNIYTIVKTCIVFVKCIFWYFRKFVVDTLISVLGKPLDVKAMSVGSTNITSDYDITLYGNYRNIGQVIYRFDDTFLKIFNEMSGRVFDTNLYGVSFIDIEPKYDSFEMSKCGVDDKITFAYTRKTQYDICVQHTFAFVKMLMRIEKIDEYDDLLYDSLVEGIYANLGYSVFVEYAQKLISLQKSDYIKYRNSILHFDEFEEMIKSQSNITDDTLIMNTYISYVNYNGFETYFTRGAFLDVVVRQMCGGKNKISLDKHDYLDSMLENVSELIVHKYKKKYIDRTMYALNQIKTQISPDIYNNISEILVEITKIQKDCSDDIYECTNNIMLAICVDCCILIAKLIRSHTNILGTSQFKIIDILVQ